MLQTILANASSYTRPENKEGKYQRKYKEPQGLINNYNFLMYDVHYLQ